MAKRGRKEAPTQRLTAIDRDALNRAFYASDPSDYFGRRLSHLLRLASQTDAELRAEPGRFTFGTLTMTVPGIDEDEADEDAHKRFIFVESEVLVHHTAETLLRMFFAHRTAPPAPWIEVSKLRGFGEFKKRLVKLPKTEDVADLRRDIGFVFLGHRQLPDDVDAERRTEYETGVARITEFLYQYADTLLHRSGTYNAVKHGLAMQAGEPSVRIGDMAELSAAGPAISYLDQDQKHGERRWVVRTRWFPLEHELGLAYIGIELLQNLWQLARARYVNWPMPNDGWKLYRPPVSVKELMEIGHDADEPRSMIAELAFPPGMHSPPGSGTDALIAKLE
jgi:hypothetical protein